MTIWIALGLAAISAERLYVSGDASARELMLERMSQSAEAGGSVMSPDRFVERLAAPSRAAAPDLEALERMLRDAREQEARFEPDGAAALRRNVIIAYDRAAEPTAELGRLAASALYDHAAALLTEGDEPGASAAARRVAILFPEVAPDEARHPPHVRQFFAQERARLDLAERDTLTIASDAPGRLWIGEVDVAEVTAGTTTVAWYRGPFRARIVSASGASFPQDFDLTHGPASLEFATDLEACIRVDEWVSYQCGERWAEHEEILAAKLGDVEIEFVDRGFVEEAAAITSISGGQSISPLSFVPFGVGQYAQDRTIVGSVFLGLNAGLLGWHAYALDQHRDAVRAEDADREERLRGRRNLTAALFWGSLVIAIAESLLNDPYEGVSAPAAQEPGTSGFSPR